VPPSPEGSSSNEAGRGRLILIVIDQPNIRFGGTIGHRAAINKFIDRLQPSDRLGVVNLGVGGTSDALKEPSTSLGLEPPAAPPAQDGRGARSRELPDVPLPAGPSGDRGPQGMDGGGELYAVAAATGGAMFTVVMHSDSALARIESELAGYYPLAIETAPADRDGKPHSFNVDLSRRGVTVRGQGYPLGVVASELFDISLTCM
jgi:hypothetical protein